jgi:hypothetical protein
VRAQPERTSDAKGRIRDERVFNEEEELAAVQRRYDVARETLVYTIPALRRNRDFMETYHRLRESGWKDWHVLLAAFNISANYRVRESGENIVWRGDLDRKARERWTEIAFTPETEALPRPPAEIFTDEAMRSALDVAILAGLTSRGWVVKNPTPNFRALRKFAAERYKYFEQDVDHEAFF